MYIKKLINFKMILNIIKIFHLIEEVDILNGKNIESILVL